MNINTLGNILMVLIGLWVVLAITVRIMEFRRSRREPQEREAAIKQAVEADREAILASLNTDFSWLKEDGQGGRRVDFKRLQAIVLTNH